MDVRGGVSYYHNEALSAGSGLNTATDVGIPGANLDEYTSGMTRIKIGNGFSNPMVGFSASLPWDRGETTVDLSTTVTKLWGNHTIKFGGTYRHNKDFLLQTQDQGGPRGVFRFNAAGTGSPGQHRLAVEHQQRDSPRSCSIGRAAAGRDLAVIPSLAPSTRRCSPSSTTSGRCRRR